MMKNLKFNIKQIWENRSKNNYCKIRNTTSNKKKRRILQKKLENSQPGLSVVTDRLNKADIAMIEYCKYNKC